MSDMNFKWLWFMMSELLMSCDMWVMTYKVKNGDGKTKKFKECYK